MKFSTKLLLCTMMVLALTLGISGFYYVTYSFHRSLEREIGQALDESSILCFALETAALNVPSQYAILPDRTVEQIASNLETGGRETARLLRLCGEDGETLYASEGFPADGSLLTQASENVRAYRVLRLQDCYYVQTAVQVAALDRTLYLETLRDVTEVFDERTKGFAVYRQMTILVLLAGTLLMHGIASLLAKPIRILTGATRQMAAGDYAFRAKKVSQDELGQLTDDFNRMAGVLEENIRKLEEAIQDREEFVGAFAHELKTPLTSIIGYADMLRSRKLDEEKQFLAANYIFTEGRRLEAMSLRLLELIVTRKGALERRRTEAAALFEPLRETFDAPGGRQMAFVFSYEPACLWVEPGLIQTALVNLVDNACKASEPGGRIEIRGKNGEEGYVCTVRDYGVGIPPEEVNKIVRPFYMVDKSRSRSHNGAGLGLALCVEILERHGSRLTVESTPGAGTEMRFTLPLAPAEEGAET